MKAPAAQESRCPLCRGRAGFLGGRAGRLDGRWYRYYACPHCGLDFVGNPWLNYKRIYNQDYYRGRGGDPSVDYSFELDHPQQSIRSHEFAGLLGRARALAGPGRFRWLDYGCGHGALIPWVRERADIDIHGWDQGAITAEARRRGVPILSRAALARSRGTWDFVSAVEVLEHHPQPLAMLKEIRGLLRPGGTLFMTTGNAARHAGKLLDWSYAQAPDVHIRFYGPRTLAFALDKAGFEVLPGGWGPGWKEIFHYKILKHFGLKRDHAVLDLCPWGLLSRLAERGQGLSEQPLGRRPT